LTQFSFGNSPIIDGHHVPIFLSICDNRIRNFCAQLLACLDELSEKKLQANFDAEYVTLTTCDVIRVIAAFETQDKAMAPLKNLLLKMAYQAEQEAGGSAFIALRICLEIIASISKAQSAGINVRALKAYSITSLLSSISNHSRSATENDSKIILQNLINDDFVLALLKVASSLAGLNGQIFVDEKCSTSTHVELRCGYNFECSLVPTYAVATNTQTWEHSHVKCIVIDGIIESVSEIHHLLKALNKMEIPALLFARGFSQEVLGTLSTNTLRGTLKVAPVIVGYTLVHANTLKDVAVACNTDVVSSLKGELISSIKLEDIPAVDRVKVTTKHVIITHKASENIVKLHTENLRKQKEEIEASGQYVGIKTEKIKMINERIKALSVNYANVGLGPELKVKKGITHDRLKNAIMVLCETARFGKIKADDIIFEIQQSKIKQNPISIGLYRSITKIKKHIPVMSVSSALTGIQRGTECALAISNIGAILLEK
jgi:hypothetical protein